MANQSNVKQVTDKLDDFSYDELKQVRDYTDNRISEVHPGGGTQAQDLQARLADMNDTELTKLREDINNRLMDDMDRKTGSADASADDEKKKYIAQYGNDPIHQERAQDVPVPVSQEGKDLQDEAAEAEHQASGANSEPEKMDRLKEAVGRQTEKAHQEAK